MKQLLFAIAAGMAVLQSALPAAAQQLERVVAPVGGISIVRPANWELAPPDAAITEMRNFRTDSPEMRAAAERATAPLIVLIRDSSTPDSPIAPTVKVNHRLVEVSLRGMDALDALESVAIATRRLMVDAEILDVPAKMQVGGVPGARVRFAHMLRYGDSPPHRVISELRIARRGDFFVMLGITYAHNESAEVVAEVEGIAASFRIDPDAR